MNGDRILRVVTINLMANLSNMFDRMNRKSIFGYFVYL